MAGEDGCCAQWDGGAMRSHLCRDFARQRRPRFRETALEMAFPCMFYSMKASKPVAN